MIKRTIKDARIVNSSIAHAALGPQLCILVWRHSCSPTTGTITALLMFTTPVALSSSLSFLKSSVFVAANKHFSDTSFWPTLLSIFVLRCNPGTRSQIALQILWMCWSTLVRIESFRRRCNCDFDRGSTRIEVRVTWALLHSGPRMGARPEQIWLVCFMVADERLLLRWGYNFEYLCDCYIGVKENV